MTKHLKDGHLACGTCGHGVAPKHQAETRTFTSLGTYTDGVRLPAHDREFKTDMTRCRDCQERRDTAQQLLEDFPKGRWIFLSDRSAVDAIEATLGACAYIRQRPKVRSDKDLRLLLEEMAGLAKANAYFARYVPLALPGARPGKANAKPWGHLDDEAAGPLKEAYVRWLLRRSETARDIEHPTGGGCYLCGVKSVYALPSHKQHCWREVQIRPASLGGQSHESETKILCGLCFERGEEVGVYGWTLLFQRIFDAAGIGHRYNRAISITGAKAWGESGLTEPNDEPFAHFDLDGVREDMASGRFNVWAR